MKVNEVCSGCGSCQSICPVNCITMKDDIEGFFNAQKDNKCIDCGLCKKVCPFLNVRLNKNFETKYYALKNRDKKIKKLSSSGGAFALLAKYILEQDGCIYGAAFDENFNVKHIRVAEYNELYKILGSKYVQSNIKNIYKDVKKDLINNKIVLFSGTGCQIAGLKNMLDKYYDNLYTVEILCHGIPSEGVWESYKKYLCSKYNSKIKSISFRDKKYGWHAYSVKIVFENGKIYTRTVDNDMYMQTYLRGYNICESCYICPCKEKERVGDITLGDLWGVNINDFKSEIEEGISLVSLNSSKGEYLFLQLINECDIKEIDNYKLKNVISNMTGYAEKILEENKNDFFNMINSTDFYNAYNTTVKGSKVYELKKRAKGRLKITLFKLKSYF